MAKNSGVSCLFLLVQDLLPAVEGETAGAFTEDGKLAVVAVRQRVARLPRHAHAL